MAFYCGTGEAPVKNWKGVAKSDFAPEKAFKISDEAVKALEEKNATVQTAPLDAVEPSKHKADQHPINRNTKRWLHLAVCVWWTICRQSARPIICVIWLVWIPFLPVLQLLSPWSAMKKECSAKRIWMALT